MVQLRHDKDELKLTAKRGKHATVEKRVDGKNYLVCHASKFKMSDVKGMHKHIQREMTSTTNEDIENDKTALNYDLSDFDKKTMNYSDEVKKRLSERYRGKKAIRKDATVMVGIIVSASPEFFEGMSEDRERRYFKEAYDFLEAVFGKENVISATVHKDEKTPHMHFNFVPLTADGRLSAKEILDQNKLAYLQDKLPIALQSMGFKISRGLPSSQTGAKHESPRDWKIRTSKNELARTEQLSARQDQRTEQRERIVADQDQRIEQRERAIASLENRGISKGYQGKSRSASTDSRVPHENGSQGSTSTGGSAGHLQNVGDRGVDMGNSDRNSTQDLSVLTAQERFSRALNKVKQQQDKPKKSNSRGGMKM